jgi:hypothetical protein
MTEETDLPGDLRRTVWKQSVPISTWLMSLAVAPFAVDHFGNYHGIPLSSWVYPQEHEAGAGAFAAHTQPVLEFYISHIGPYAYEKLAQVQANGVGGGMELASSIFYGYGATGAGRQLVAHEMAHQYFGDSVTEGDWDDVWLSEGFATYFALLFQEFADGHDAFVDGVRRSKTQALDYAIANPASTIITATWRTSARSSRTTPRCIRAARRSSEHPRRRRYPDVLGWHPRVLRALHEWDSPDGRLPPRDGGGMQNRRRSLCASRQGFVLAVQRAAQSRRRASGDRHVEL